VETREAGSEDRSRISRLEKIIPVDQAPASSNEMSAEPVSDPDAV
jgi:hypothetical protein